MANITKKRDKKTQAPQYWDTSTDLDDGGGAIGVGDIFRIETSLGKPAKNLAITTGAGAISIRINGQVVNYPTRANTEFFYAEIYKNLATGVEHTDTSIAPIVIGANQVFTMSGEVPIKTIEIVAKAANFTMIVD